MKVDNSDTFAGQRTGPYAEYDDEPAAMRFVQEPFKTRIVEDARERRGVADIAVGFDELLVRFGNGSQKRYA